MATQPSPALDTPLPRRTRPAQMRSGGGFRWQTVLIVLMLCLWEAFPLAPLGVNPLLSYQIFAAIVFSATPLCLLRMAVRRQAFTYWNAMPILLVLVCIGVSVYYSGVVSPQPLVQWLPAIYTVSPVLLIFLLKLTGTTYRDGENAIYIAGIIGSIIIFVNGMADLHLLDYYIRGSGFGTENRVVFFKLESTFALMIGLVRFAYARRFLGMVGAGFAIFFTFYNVFVLSESRLAIAAILIGAFLTWLFIMRGGRKLFFLLAGPFVAIPVVVYVIDKYLRASNNLTSYLQNDVSATFRNIEIDHYRNYFEGTNGIGFGFMSGNPRYDNIISYSANRAGAKYGVPDYPLSLDDIGIFSAIYQYGYLGVAIILTMTLLTCWKLARTGQSGNAYVSLGALGMLMFAFLLSPISMNYFTIFYTAHMGGLLWFIAASAPAPQPSQRRLRRPRLDRDQPAPAA